MSFLHTFGGGDADMQRPFDVSVVIPTINRPHLKQAVESVYAQDLPGRIQILIGLDVPSGHINALCKTPPANRVVQYFWPGYSTSTRHGGVTPSWDGGALRTILTYMANSPYVAYLDDDNWWSPNHLSTLLAAIDGADWAYSYRWYVHPETRQPICVDLWESGGPGRGIHTAAKGGFVDPSCLMIDKTQCRSAPQCWTFPLEIDPMSADCVMFGFLSRAHTSRGTGRATAYYTLNPNDPQHANRLVWMGDRYENAGRLYRSVGRTGERAPAA